MYVNLTSAVLSFAVVAALLTITPGLDTALVLRAGISNGRRSAFATALGICMGALTWGAAAAVGVSALVAASRIAYTGLRIVGACYMIWLGGRMLWTAFRGNGGRHDLAESAEATASSSFWASWGRGLLTNLLNPKVGAFYVALLPQFIPAGASHLGVGLLLASVHAAESLLWFTAIILGARGLRRFLRRRAAQRAIDGGTGVVLIGFGLKLGFASR